MTRPAQALLILLVALTAGCASLPAEIEELHSSDQEDRIDAAISLAGRFTDRDPDVLAAKEEVARELRRLLDDRSALVRQVAVDSLATIEGKAASSALVDRLRDKDPWVRYAAARQLGALEARTAAELLADLLRRDESADVRRAAAQALAKIKARGALRELYLALQDDTPSVRYQAYVALRAITGEDHGEDPRAWRPLVPRGPGE
jgi:HEAT repeat protein